MGSRSHRKRCFQAAAIEDGRGGTGLWIGTAEFAGFDRRGNDRPVVHRHHFGTAAAAPEDVRRPFENRLLPSANHRRECAEPTRELGNRLLAPAP